jgi:hypothetical protein
MAVRGALISLLRHGPPIATAVASQEFSMAEVDQEVMAFVESELARTPDMGSGDLFEKAKAEVPSIGALTLRQFHARYPLQVKRRASVGRRKRKPRSRKKSAGSGARRGKRSRGASAPRDAREAVRAVLMRFATELASAEVKADVVKVLAGADRYVDEVIEAASS